MIKVGDRKEWKKTLKIPDPQPFINSLFVQRQWDQRNRANSPEIFLRFTPSSVPQC